MPLLAWNAIAHPCRIESGQACYRECIVSNTSPVDVCKSISIKSICVEGKIHFIASKISQIASKANHMNCKALNEIAGMA